MDNLHAIHERLKNNLINLLEKESIEYSVEERHNGYIVYGHNYSCAMHNNSFDSLSETIEIYSSLITENSGEICSVFITRFSVESAVRLIKYLIEHPKSSITEDEAYRIAGF